MGTTGSIRANALLLHYLLLGLAAILTGLVHQLSSWRDLPSIDPGLLPFAVMLVGGLLISSIASFVEGAVAGMYAGFLVACSGIFFGLLLGGEGVPSVRTGFSYLAIMTCLGPFFGGIGAIPGTLLKKWVEKRRGGHQHPENPKQAG